MAKIFFLFPIFNEEPNILRLAENLLRIDVALSEFTEKVYVFSDDCSTDGTISVLEKAFPRDRLRIVRARKNGGPGAAFQLGFEYILEQEQAEDDDIVVTMEADNTSDPSILVDMLAINRLGYDLVLASIYAQGGGLERTTPLRKVLSVGANFFFRAVFDVSVLTLSSFYRACSVSLLRRIQSRYGPLMEERGFICALEFLLKAISVKAKVLEVPMVLRSHARVGQSKMKIGTTMLAYLRFLVTWKLRHFKSTDARQTLYENK